MSPRVFFIKEKNSFSSFLCPIFQKKKILFFCVCVFLVFLSECCHVDDRRDWTLILLEPELCENLFELFFSLLLHQNSWQCNGVLLLLLPLLQLKFFSFYHHLPRWIKPHLKNRITIQKQKKLMKQKQMRCTRLRVYFIGILVSSSFISIVCVCVCVCVCVTSQVVMLLYIVSQLWKMKESEIDWNSGRIAVSREKTKQKIGRAISLFRCVFCFLSRYRFFIRPIRPKVINHRSRKPSSVQSRERQRGQWRIESRTSKKLET